MNHPIRSLSINFAMAGLMACAQAPSPQLANSPTQTTSPQISVTGNLEAEADKPKAGLPYGQFGPSEFGKTIVLVPWLSSEGQKRFEAARYKQDFYQLAQTYQPQINPFYCGIATSVIVLNALRLSKGEAPHQPNLEIAIPSSQGTQHIEYRNYLQSSLLNAETDKVKARNIIEYKNAGQGTEPNPGLALMDLKGVLESHHAHVELTYADDEDLKVGTQKLRETAKRVLMEPLAFLVANFKGVALGTKTGGHISPVGAYDAKTDSLLIVDVASHKNPWYWVPVSQLYQAMHTLDGGHYRGYLVVSDSLPVSAVQ